ncbi:uncharacterized protein LY79DRAFT_584460 [Colletotrichum navitas]|uniref:Uncharacterized protein n=1 Tax=Colletotrichum navitas TaxID=681940 RepID=A0AAD8UY53_9PEZI|nr:uncharacterized protein LY79DRAFT_584460 [Colletotrichum navitas]KAK1569806.1 hypothetical protein LY79DRAFT_584460 [Colletotrichum navitas]
MGKQQDETKIIVGRNTIPQLWFKFCRAASLISASDAYRLSAAATSTSAPTAPDPQHPRARPGAQQAGTTDSLLCAVGGVLRGRHRVSFGGLIACQLGCTPRLARKRAVEAIASTAGATMGLPPSKKRQTAAAAAAAAATAANEADMKAHDKEEEMEKEVETGRYASGRRAYFSP